MKHNAIEGPVMYYGFDIGGTKIEFGAFDEQFERVATERVATPTHNYPALIAVITELVTRYDAKFAIQGKVGLGIPGVEGRDGTLLTANIPAAFRQPFRRDVEKALSRSVSIENDANCFALSEAWAPSCQGYSSVLGLILGTGVGGGWIQNGKVWSGYNHVAGEIGHMRLPMDAWFALGENAPVWECGCGQKGCIETYLSGRGFERLYQHWFEEALSAQQIMARYSAGDVATIEYVERFLDVLAITLANLLTVLDPDAVVLGGGLSNIELLYQELPQRITPYLLPIAQCPPILAASYGDAGGVRGAALLNYRA